jgi:ATP-dependent DNA ligase
MCTIAVKLKFDCSRVQTHKGGDEVSTSICRLESVSSFLPDVIEAVLKGVQAENAILDGDLVAV